MSGTAQGQGLAAEPDFNLGALRVSPSTGRVLIGNDELRLEAKTMAVLVVLARAAGATVTRDELINACWQGRIVSDDAITRTLAKVRAIARGIEPAPFMVETIPKLGYRLKHSCDGLPAATAVAPRALAASGRRSLKLQRGWYPLAAALMVAIAIPISFSSLLHKSVLGEPDTDAQSTSLPRASEMAEALILLDRSRVKRYLDQGWDPNWSLDAEGSAALHTVLLACERDPSHDRGSVAVIAQMLVVAGADAESKNKWGDTPLEIARSKRYCGPYHPVVDYLRSMSPADTVH